MRIEIIGVVVAAAVIALQGPQPRINVNSGQVGKRYQIFSSPFVRADTFNLDTSTGFGYLLVEDKDGRPSWQFLEFLDGDPSDPILNKDVGPHNRYQIVYGLHARADTFLLDTSSGRTWLCVKRKNGSMAFEKMEGP